MPNFIEKIKSKVQKIVDKANGNSLSQQLNAAVGERYVTEGIPELIRQASAESITLLKCDGALPLKSSDRVSIFGRCQIDYFFIGYGSGGDVKPPYKVSLLEAMREGQERGKWRLNEDLAQTYSAWRNKKENLPFDGWWGHWPMNYPEMPLDRSVVDKAAEDSDVAIVVIGRAAGEDRENTLEKGSYYLTDEEKNMLDLVTGAFDKVVVIMNLGNIMDMEWAEAYGERICAILFAWQGGMESGRSIADVLSGEINPCGKLPDTIARKYEDYPSSDNFGGKEYNEYVEDIFVGYRYFETFAKDKALYPFGFGLSYTDFSIALREFHADGDKVRCVVEVKNVGNCDGKEVAQMYVRCPQGKLGKPSICLVAFEKTEVLRPNESQLIALECNYYDFASFDDVGESGHLNSYILEKGTYGFFVGGDVRTENLAGEFVLDDDLLISALEGICDVRYPFERFKAVEKNGEVVLTKQSVPAGNTDMKKRILDDLPKANGFKGDKGYKFADVKSGRISLDEFISQLTNRELEALTRGGGGMNHPKGVEGNAGAYGGVIPSLEAKGVPCVITTDGPSGIRIGRYTALLPCGTALAATWNTRLVAKLYEAVGKEMLHYGVDVLLGAGMNIHRNPLCGRNFEYFSEDPLLTGKMASAFVNGVQSVGKAACVKHFACNNQETNRNYNDSRVSVRALREIYLKAFEICVKDSSPLNIMTSYNKINGVWSHYNYDLATTVLRKEWNFQGLVITDWWLRKGASEQFPKIKTHAYRVRAQVDVFMPGNHSRTCGKYKSDGSLLATLGKEGGITRGELERCAKNTLTLILKLDK